MAEPDRNQTVQDLFQRALDLAADERPGFLDENCSDAEMRGEIESLLAAFDDANEFLAEPPISAPGEQAGDEIGRYRLLEQIGEGGFGVVWMAEQQEPVRRRVAIKIIKLGMDTRQVVARFEAERQALALMDHPNIAKVFDGGATDAGRPYFVMELVRGVSVTEYCDKANLDTKGRLDLFQRICLAVQHAHQKGIIHRDLKPSNVLVTLHDGEPVPKVIDFGVAKATSQELTQRTLFTQFRQMIGTPEYMAPEQAEMSGLDIDTRADVYSLGVILYELLTGTKPLDAKELLQDGYEEMMRHVREVDPPKPSTRISTLGDQLSVVAQSRQIDPTRLGRVVRGELDWIAMRALEKQRQRRYPTARALAEDVRRFLENEPIEAGPPTASYRASKFLRRNRGMVTTLAVVFLTLVAGVVATGMALKRARDSEQTTKAALVRAQDSEQATAAALQRAQTSETEAVAALQRARDSEQTTAKALVRAQESEKKTATALQRAQTSEADAVKALTRAKTSERETKNALQLAETQKLEAERQVERSRLTVGFLQSMLASSNPNAAKRPDLTVRDLLDDADSDVRLLNADPEVAATIRTTIGSAYMGLGQLDKAEKHLRKALEARQASLGKDHLLVADSLSTLAWLQHDRSKYASAERTMQAAIETAKKTLEPDDIWFAPPARSLADFAKELGKLPDALRHSERALKLLRDHKVTDARLVMALQTRGNILAATGKFLDAEMQLREVVDLLRQEYGPRHVRVGYALSALGDALQSRNKLDEAEVMQTEALDICRESLGVPHVEVASCLNSLAIISEAKGKYEESEQRYRESLAADPGVDVKHVITRANLAMTLMRLKKYSEAEEEYDGAIKGLGKYLTPNHPTTAMIMQNKGRLLEVTGRLAEAEELLLRVIAMRKNSLPEIHPHQAVARSMLGMVQHARNRSEEAEKTLTEAVRIVRGSFQQPHFFQAITIANHALVLRALSRPAEAGKLLEEAATIYEKTDGRTYAWAEVRTSLAATMIDTNRVDEAEPIAKEALTLLVDKRPDSPQRWWAAGVLGEIRAKQDEPAEARTLLEEAAENFASRRPQHRARRVRILTQLIDLLESQKADDAAASWRKKLEEVNK